MPVVIPGPDDAHAGEPKAWPTIEDCENRLGVDPADESDVASLQASLDATITMVIRAKPELVGTTVIDADYWQGIVLLACLDYRAGNTPNGFAGYDGGLGWVMVQNGSVRNSCCG